MSPARNAPTAWTLAALLGALLAPVAAPSPAAAEPLRDPMKPPAAMARAPRAGAASATDDAAQPLSARHLITVDGKRWVVDGGIRRGVGDRLGDARIESIEDSAVVVRRGGVLQRVPLFAGVSKRIVPAATAGAPAPARAASAPPAAPTRTALATAAHAPRPRTSSPGDMP